jgi:hypothetical protein
MNYELMFFCVFVFLVSLSLIKTTYNSSKKQTYIINNIRKLKHFNNLKRNYNNISQNVAGKFQSLEILRNYHIQRHNLTFEANITNAASFFAVTAVNCRHFLLSANELYHACSFAFYRNIYCMD